MGSYCYNNDLYYCYDKEKSNKLINDNANVNLNDIKIKERTIYTGLVLPLNPNQTKKKPKTIFM